MVKLRHELTIIGVNRLCSAFPGDINQRPPGICPFPQRRGILQGREIGGAERQNAAGREFENALPNAMILRQPASAEKFRNRVRIDLRDEFGEGGDRLQLGSKGDGIRVRAT